MAKFSTRIALPRINEAVATFTALLREEQDRTVAITLRTEEAKRVLADYEKEGAASIQRQSFLTGAIAVAETVGRIGAEKDELSAASESDDLAAQIKSVPQHKPPARLGKQHYRMLHALRRAAIPLGVFDVAGHSFVAPRRVKNQLVEDALRGLLTSTPEGYVITPSGLDLISRFEDYRRSINQPLPSLNEQASDEESDEPEQDDVGLALSEGQCA